MIQNLKFVRDRNMGDNLRYLRKKSKLSQEKLCAKLQLSSYYIDQSTYAKYEAGNLNIPISLVIILRKMYNCAYDDFFEGLE